MIRPRQQMPLNKEVHIVPDSKYDYQILLLKRNSKISFGNFFAFPGGMLEKQDLKEKWEKSFPSFYQQHGAHVQDFVKRMCCLRELYEETNILLSEEQTQNEHANMTNYLKKHKSHFSDFCKDYSQTPKISGLQAFHRIGSPIGLHPANDSQFYLYFEDNNLKNQKIVLNEEEFTEYKWLSPDEALTLYEQQKIPLFPPQVVLISMLLFLSPSYQKLQQIASQLNTNLLNYQTNKMHYMALAEIKDEDELRKLVKKIFDKTDLMSDQQRTDLYVYNNQPYIDKHEELKSLGKEKTYDQLVELTKHVAVGLWYGDHYSTCDNYGFNTDRRIRRRSWTHKQTVIRIEISDQLMDDSITMPKL
ncbi:nucleoside diphosphate-linked moiety x motif mitochondrial-like [Stylonychia lemnae]|uniref:Nucleoside diphosphate-linked moiety x motif mitochondrial-like n=1 Tax=Stylonychia lemnae TaxID=5949 RepID=A0A078A436_STYLE|nr:nucleoside diphosphate-linked moiety x motif mitochondrial-like [Stylonychia lemnae]|eukprot:CDW77033.1 nucleoside diphosphate-linked moiety x motif mitochondrial-like [Stylonychia lemnae]